MSDFAKPNEYNTTPYPCPIAGRRLLARLALVQRLDGVRHESPPNPLVAIVASEVEAAEHRNLGVRAGLVGDPGEDAALALGRGGLLGGLLHGLLRRGLLAAAEGGDGGHPADRGSCGNRAEDQSLAAAEGGEQGEQAKLTDSILDATVEPEAWRIELERVTPQLKMQVLSDPKEWRNRLASTKVHQQTVAQLAPETYQTLDRLSEDMEKTLVAVRKAEQKLNAQCQGEVAELADKQDELQTKQEEYNKQSEFINALTNELAGVSEELQAIKGRMDERGNSMTDTSPLIKIKSALTRLKTEAKQMDIRIGVVTHTLVAKKLKRDQYTKAEAALPKNQHIKDESYLDDDLDID